MRYLELYARLAIPTTCSPGLKEAKIERAVLNVERWLRRLQHRTLYRSEGHFPV